MKIQTRQIETFRAALLKHFEERALDHARRCYPAHSAQHSMEGLRRYLAAAMKRAPSYGLHSEQQVICFFDTMLLLGAAFDSDPRHKWSSRVLVNSSYSADYRANYLLSKACCANNAAVEESTYGGY
jgi:hypothetical protein